MRRRTIDLEGGDKLVISPLTREQVEYYGKVLNDEETPRTMAQAYDILVCMSMNNAQGIYGLPEELFKLENGVHIKLEENGQTLAPIPVWTPERLFQELDPHVFFNVLPDEIFKLTGLTVKPRESKETQQGEPPATSPALPAVPVAA